MSELSYQQEAAEGFSRQAAGFDAYDRGNTIIHYKRQRVRDHALSIWPSQGSILELNAGTGEDAIFFAGKGFRVHATDIAEGMQARLRGKVRERGLTDVISQEICSFTDLEQLKARGPYDCIFSNFAGLNCTNRLDTVLSSFYPLLKPGGHVTLVILPPFSLFETMLLLKGKWRTAFRRPLAGRKGARSHVEGHYFQSWYYRPSFVRKALGDRYEPVKLEGLCTIVPPSYMEGFAEKWPRLYRWACHMEDRLKSRWPWRSIGDYYIISLRRRSE